MSENIYWVCRKPSDDLPVTPYRVTVDADRYAGCFCRVVDAAKPTFFRVYPEDLHETFEAAQAAAIAECDAISQDAIGRRRAIERASESS